MTEDLTLEDLATRSNLTLRTLRFYIQEGILPGPDTHGKNARYSREHLDRLELIQRLKDLRLPLQEIKQILDNMTSEEISKVRHYQDLLQLTTRRPRSNKSNKVAPAGTPSDALDYIRSLELGRQNVRVLMESKVDFLNSMPAPVILPDLINIPDDQSNPGEETWTRIALADGIELNIRTNLGKEERQKITKLIALARSMFRNQDKREEK